MATKKMMVNGNEKSLILDSVDMASISGKKRAAEPRPEKQNLIILNQTNISSDLTQQIKNLTIDVLICVFDLLHIQLSSALMKKKTYIK